MIVKRGISNGNAILPFTEITLIKVNAYPIAETTKNMIPDLRMNFFVEIIIGF